jgi:hypothetical protein
MPLTNILELVRAPRWVVALVTAVTLAVPTAFTLDARYAHAEDLMERQEQTQYDFGQALIEIRIEQAEQQLEIFKWKEANGEAMDGYDLFRYGNLKNTRDSLIKRQEKLDAHWQARQLRQRSGSWW